MIRTLAAALVTSTCMVALATPAAAQTREYNIPAGSLKSALDAYVRQSGQEVVYRADQVRSARSPGTRGHQSAEAALASILAGTGFTTRIDGDLVAIVRVGNAKSTTRADIGSSEDIVVTGTRIRGAPSASPVIAVSAEQARQAGQTDLGEILRSIPQNFNGGSNPGIGFGAESAGSEPSSGQSAPNLRGIGASATLTLLNGRRLPYSLSGQGVDISSIPLAAVQRIEVVPDGSSALYGSDAVAGVINVRLNRDYDGMTVTSRGGLSTDGGYRTVGTETTVGTQWQSGGIMAAGGYSQNTMLRARDRDYVTNSHGSATLYPRLQTWSGVVSAHQELTPGVKLRIDGLYTDRSSLREVANTTTGDYRVAGNIRHEGSRSLFISPTLQFALPARWNATLNYSHGRDNSRALLEQYRNGAFQIRQFVKINNTTNVGELDAEGPLFALPAGDARLAVGGGYRRIDFDRGTGPTLDTLIGFEAARHSYYGYGEVFIPLVSPDMGISGIHRLSLTAALRHEDYNDFGGTSTPKLSVIYAPNVDLQLSATWGHSFKTPTLQQQNSLPVVSLAYPSRYGGTGYASSATALYISGGTPNLEPETSTNWSTTLTITPRSMAGLRVELTYFNIDYRDRIVAPIASTATALSNPIYAPFVNRNPTTTAVAAATALPINASYFSSLIDGPFNPSNVAVIIDGRNTNVASQAIEGVDFTASYKVATGASSQLVGSLNIAYLESTRVLLPGAAETPLAGTVFNPPHWRARGGLGWSDERLSISSYVNYIGALNDMRTTTVYELEGQATFDLTIGYKIDSGVLDGFSIQLAALNLFDAAPRAVVMTSAGTAPYDSTNYSPIGRYLSLAVTKRF